MRTNDVAEVAGALTGSMLVAVVIVIGIAAILMPLYVIHMSGQVDRMRKALERLLWLEEQRAKRPASRPSDWLPPEE